MEVKILNKQEYTLFMSIRQMVASYIREYLKNDRGHKSYEGTWEVFVSYPSYFEDETATSVPDYYKITLNCYVLGPCRNYDWIGKTWMEVLGKCKKDIEQWIKDYPATPDSDNGGTWKGKTWTEVLRKCKKGIKQWVRN